MSTKSPIILRIANLSSDILACRQAPTSVQRGEAIMLYHNIINATPTIVDQPPMVQIEVFRSGWYGGLGGRKVFGPVQVPGILQTRTELGEDGIIVCKWKDPYALQTQKDWTTGVYLVKLTNIMNPEAMMQMQSYAIFVVRDNERPADIMVQLPTNTYQAAYNIWGGKNLLHCKLNKNCQKAAKVYFDRPYVGPENTVAAFGTGAAEYLVNVQPLDYPIPTATSWNCDGWNGSILIFPVYPMQMYILICLSYKIPNSF